MSDVYVKYVGQKQSLNVQFPVPFIAKCEAIGDPVEFKKGKPTKVTYEQSQQLLNAAPNVFERVEMEAHNPAHKAAKS